MYQAFGKWQPDAEDLGTGLSSEALNVLPGANCYYPWRELASLSGLIPTGATVVGAAGFITSDGTVVIVAGTASGLYLLNSSFGWDDVSRNTVVPDYLASTTTPWRFTLFENQGSSYIIAVNINDNPQVYEVGVSTDFADLGGSPPKAAVCGVWGQQLVLGQLAGFPNAVQGSDIDDPTTWTPSASNNAFYQEFADGGAVTGFNSSDAPVIIQERAIRRGLIVGLPTKVVFEQIASDRGARSIKGITSRDDKVFFLAEDGFYAVTAQGGVTPIGYQAVNRWFLENAADLEGVQGAVDPIYSRVYWGFRSMDAGGTEEIDTILAYDWQSAVWTRCYLGKSAVSVLVSAATPGLSLEALETLYGSLESIPSSLDARVYAIGAPSFGAIFKRKFATFSGAPMAATMTTAEFPNAPQRRLRLQRAIPVIDTNDATVTVRRRNTRGDAFTAGSAVSVNTSGHWPLNHSGRFFELQMNVPGGSVWTKAQGVHIDAVPEGVR